MGSTGKKIKRTVSKITGGGGSEKQSFTASAPKPMQANAGSLVPAGAREQAQFREAVASRGTLGSGTLLTDVFGLRDDAQKRRKTLLGG